MIQTQENAKFSGAFCHAALVCGSRHQLLADDAEMQMKGLDLRVPGREQVAPHHVPLGRGP
eukprot:1959090-Pleurochrysis_carterae.AAC.2